MMPQLPAEAIIEAPLVLKDGTEQVREIRVPEALADICCFGVQSRALVDAGCQGGTFQDLH